MCYKGELDKRATVKKRQPDGTFKMEIDEDMRQYITIKLIEALPTFPLEEMEREEKEIGTKNHKKVDGKLMRTDKQFRHLKQRQKETVSTWLFMRNTAVFGQKREMGDTQIFVQSPILFLVSYKNDCRPENSGYGSRIFYCSVDSASSVDGTIVVNSLSNVTSFQTSSFTSHVCDSCQPESTSL